MNVQNFTGIYLIVVETLQSVVDPPAKQSPCDLKGIFFYFAFLPLKDPIFLLSGETEAVMESIKEDFKYIFKTSGKEKL